MSDITVESDEAQVARRARLLGGLDRLRVRGGLSQLANERTLMLIGGILAPTGLLLVLLGWYGAAHTPHLFEQVPYLISGGLVGLGLSVLGGFFYFAHWITEMIKEQRRSTDQLVDAITELRAIVEKSAAATAEVAQVAANGSAATARTRRRPAATAKR